MRNDIFARDLSALHNSSAVQAQKITVTTAGTELPIVTIGYSTGTITVEDGSKALVGVGTSFVGNVSVGDVIETVGGNIYHVALVTNDLNLVLQANASADEAGVAYKAYTTPATVRVKLRADDGNANNIYIGRIGVTSSTGFELDAGKEIDIVLNNRSPSANLYADGGANGQVVWVFFEIGGTMEVFVPNYVTAGQTSNGGGGAAAVQMIGTKQDSAAVFISALSGNAASVYIGDSTVSATLGFELVPGTNAVFYVNDKSADLYIYADAGEGVSYLITRT